MILTPEQLEEWRRDAEKYNLGYIRDLLDTVTHWKGRAEELERAYGAIGKAMVEKNGGQP